MECPLDRQLHKTTLIFCIASYSQTDIGVYMVATTNDHDLNIMVSRLRRRSVGVWIRWIASGSDTSRLPAGKSSAWLSLTYSPMHKAHEYVLRVHRNPFWPVDLQQVYTSSGKRTKENVLLCYQVQPSTSGLPPAT